MKKSKLLLTILLCILSFLLLTGCSNDSDKKANCSALECIKKIKVDNTVEEVNKIIGVKGVLYDKENKFYRYDLDNGETITLKYYSSDTATITASYNKKELANRKVDLSNLNSLKKKVNSGITYDKFKEEVGGVDGTLIEKSKISKTYFWASKDGGYITAIFKEKDNKCFYFYGYGDVR
ncbi:unknown [Clostridium sp. CAG:433]|nr:unknown [Clostridium sp. CAG:433]